MSGGSGCSVNRVIIAKRFGHTLFRGFAQSHELDVEVASSGFWHFHPSASGIAGHLTDSDWFRVPRDPIPGSQGRRAPGRTHAAIFTRLERAHQSPGTSKDPAMTRIRMAMTTIEPKSMFATRVMAFMITSGCHWP